MEVKETRFVTWSEVKRILEKKAKEKELGYEQKNSLEFLRKFSKVPEKKATELVKELSSIERLNDRHITAIINMLPINQDELRLLLAHEIISLSEEEKNKIIAAVKKFT